MANYDHVVTVTASTKGQSDQIMAERVTNDDEYDFVDKSTIGHCDTDEDS